MGKPSRDKGKRGERELAKEFRRYGIDARRGQQFRGGGDSPDVIGLPGYHVECKRNEALSLYPSLEQSIRDAPAGSIPIVVHRRNDHEWVVVTRLSDFLKREGFVPGDEW